MSDSPEAHINIDVNEHEPVEQYTSEPPNGHEVKVQRSIENDSIIDDNQRSDKISVSVETETNGSRNNSRYNLRPTSKSIVKEPLNAKNYLVNCIKQSS